MSKIKHNEQAKTEINIGGMPINAKDMATLIFAHQVKHVPVVENDVEWINHACVMWMEENLTVNQAIAICNEYRKMQKAIEPHIKKMEQLIERQDAFERRQ